jgi:hypothetical protein
MKPIHGLTIIMICPDFRQKGNGFLSIWQDRRKVELVDLTG